MDVVTINNISLFYLVKQIDSMLAWVYTVLDHSTSCAIFSFLSHFTSCVTSCGTYALQRGMCLFSGEFGVVFHQDKTFRLVENTIRKVKSLQKITVDTQVMRHLNLKFNSSNSNSLENNNIQISTVSFLAVNFKSV